MMSNDRRVFVPLQKIDLPVVSRKQVREAERGEIIDGKKNEPADCENIGSYPKRRRQTVIVGQLEQKNPLSGGRAKARKKLPGTE
jgi:hypothetical protein